MSNFRIGELAKRADVNVETIRYYERRGLLAPPPRSASGYRQYDELDVGRITFIKRAQSLGFTLAEITDLLRLRVDPDGSCGDVEDRARQTLARIEGKVEELARMKVALERLVSACENGRPTSACPIIEGLESVRELTT